MISARAQSGLANKALCNYQDRLYDASPYDAVSNPTGYIRLSSADNWLSADLVERKFSSLNWSRFNTKTMFSVLSGGEPAAMESVTSFVNDYCRQGLAPVRADELVILPGVTTCNDLLSQVLFEQDDIVLMPSPNYYRFTNDLGDRGLVKIAMVPTRFDSEQLSTTAIPNGELKGHELEVEVFEGVYESANSKGAGRVRALLIANPQNPKGDYYTLDELRPIVKWALKKELFVILDEIYDLCVYDPHPTHGGFRSAVELFETEEERARLVWMWGMSKNFSVPGLRVSMLYSPNEEVRTAVRRFNMFHQPNALTQFVVKEMLSDRAWVDGVYFPENRKRLKARRDFTIAILETIPHVRYIKPRVGFFILVDFSQYLAQPTFEEEHHLHKHLLEIGVILSAGETIFCTSPGWFRLVFTSVDEETLREGLRRIAKALKNYGSKY